MKLTWEGPQALRLCDHCVNPKAPARSAPWQTWGEAGSSRHGEAERDPQLRGPVFIPTTASHCKADFLRASLWSLPPLASPEANLLPGAPNSLVAFSNSSFHALWSLERRPRGHWFTSQISSGGAQGCAAPTYEYPYSSQIISESGEGSSPGLEYTVAVSGPPEHL